MFHRCWSEFVAVRLKKIKAYLSECEYRIKKVFHPHYGKCVQSFSCAVAWIYLLNAGMGKTALLFSQEKVISSLFFFLPSRLRAILSHLHPLVSFFSPAYYDRKRRLRSFHKKWRGRRKCGHCDITREKHHLSVDCRLRLLKVTSAK